MNVKDKVAIVTASTKGIGLESALLLAKHGAKVYLAARNQELAENIINQHKELGLNFVKFDVKDESTIANAIKEVYEKEKRIDVLVNNFGASNPMKDKTIFDTEYNYYIENLNDNIKSVFITSQVACNYMKDNGGSIINISSIGSITPDLSRISYVTSKAAINSLTENIALQGGKYNIRCNAVLPGLTATDAVKNNMPKEFIDIFVNSTPLSRAGLPIEVANAVLFFASEESSYITGQILAVSGGFGNTTPIYGFFNKK